MAKSIGNLSVMLTLNARGFFAAMSRASKAVNTFRGVLGRITSSIFNFRNLLIGGSAAAIAHFIDKNLQAADAQIDLAKTLNTSVKGLQALTLVAGEAGISQESLTSGLQKMAVSIGDAKRGNMGLVKIFNQLKISYATLKGLQPEEQFALIAERLGDVKDAQLRASMAQDIFGRGAAKLAQLMANNNDSLKDARRFIESAGLAWSDNLSPGIERANDALQRAKSVFRGIAIQLSVQLAPIIEAVSNAFTKWATSGGGVANKVAAGLDEVLITSASLLRIWDGFRILWNDIEAAIAQAFANFLKGYAIINNSMSNLLGSVGLSGQAQKFAPTRADMDQIKSLEDRATRAATISSQLRNAPRADELIREVQGLREDFRRAAVGIEKLPRGVQ